MLFFGAAAAVDFCPTPMRLSKSMDRPLLLHVEGEGYGKVRERHSYVATRWGLSGSEYTQPFAIYTNTEPLSNLGWC